MSILHYLILSYLTTCTHSYGSNEQNERIVLIRYKWQNNKQHSTVFPFVHLFKYSLRERERETGGQKYRSSLLSTVSSLCSSPVFLQLSSLSTYLCKVYLLSCVRFKYRHKLLHSFPIGVCKYNSTLHASSSFCKVNGETWRF